MARLWQGLRKSGKGEANGLTKGEAMKGEKAPPDMGGT